MATFLVPTVLGATLLAVSNNKTGTIPAGATGVYGRRGGLRGLGA